jgi:hypothetical protein
MNPLFSVELELRFLSGFPFEEPGVIPPATYRRFRRGFPEQKSNRERRLGGLRFPAARRKDEMLKSLMLVAAMLSAPVLAQTAPTPAPSTTPSSDDRAAILDDAATTPRAGETDVGATRAPDMHPVGMGGPRTAVQAYPPCTRTRTDSCTQRGRR